MKQYGVHSCSGVQTHVRSYQRTVQKGHVLCCLSCEVWEERWWVLVYGRRGD